MTLTATEYFVSCYGCPLSPPYCDHIIKTGYNCELYNIGGCGNWRLRYRCRIGDLTEKELEYFKQKNDIGNIDHVDYGNYVEHVEHDDPDEYVKYLLHSVNYLSLDSLEWRGEHVQARDYFECYPKQNCEDPEIRLMKSLEIAAEQIRKMRYGETPLPYFADSKIACIFYKMEMKIIKEATRCRLGAIREEKTKPNANVAELEAEEAQLKTDCKAKLQEFRELQEKVNMTITSPVVIDKNLTSSTPDGTTGAKTKIDTRIPQPPEKKPKGTRNKKSKYEEFTRAYLEQLRDKIMEAPPEKKSALQATAANLTPMDIAEKIKDSFKAKIENVEKRVSKTKAWTEEKTKILKPAMASYYNTRTFNDRQNTNSPFQEVQ